MKQLLLVFALVLCFASVAMGEIDCYDSPNPTLCREMLAIIEAKEKEAWLQLSEKIQKELIDLLATDRLTVKDVQDAKDLLSANTYERFMTLAIQSPAKNDPPNAIPYIIRKVKWWMSHTDVQIMEKFMTDSKYLNVEEVLLEGERHTIYYYNIKYLDGNATIAYDFAYNSKAKTFLLDLITITPALPFLGIDDQQKAHNYIFKLLSQQYGNRYLNHSDFSTWQKNDTKISLMVPGRKLGEDTVPLVILFSKIKHD